jgi:hypothetical protein
MQLDRQLEQNLQLLLIHPGQMPPGFVTERRTPLCLNNNKSSAVRRSFELLRAERHKFKPWVSRLSYVVFNLSRKG